MQFAVFQTKDNPKAVERRPSSYLDIVRENKDFEQYYKVDTYILWLKVKIH